MEEMLSRTAMLLGEEALEKLARARVAVFGVGGVGGYVVEALVRCGIGAVDIIDNDVVCESNLNRQIIATRSNIGRQKVDVMEARIKDIHPDCQVRKHQCFYLPETAEQFDFKEYSYVVDAIDTVTGKIQLVLQAQEAGVPIISSMGTGNKLNPMELEIADIYETSVCPLAKVMRRELKKRGVKKLKVLYSKEEPRKPVVKEDTRTENSIRKATPGSVAFVPSVAGLIIASEVIKDLVK